MKSIYHLATLAIALVVFSCGDKSSTGESIPAATAEPGKPTDLIGNYEGVLPCSDCKGIRTTLELKKDGTYIIRELAITDSGGKDMGSFKGKFEVTDGGNKVLLKDVSDRPYKWFSSEESLSLYPMDEQGSARLAGTEALKRTSFFASSRSGFSVFELVQSEKRYPAKVFQQAQGGDVIIDKTYLSAASEKEKAIASLYARIFQAGCDAEGCVLNESLGQDALALADRYFQGDAPVTQELSAGPKGTLQALVVIVSGGRIRTQYSYTDGQGNIRNFMDEFTDSGSGLSRTKTQEIDSTRQRSVKGIQTHTAGPQDAEERQKIIDSKGGTKKK